MQRLHVVLWEWRHYGGIIYLCRIIKRPGAGADKMPVVARLMQLADEFFLPHLLPFSFVIPSCYDRMTRVCIADARKLCESMDAFNHATHHHYVCVYSPSGCTFPQPFLRPQRPKLGLSTSNLSALFKSRSWFPSFQSGFTQNDSWMVIRHEGVPHVPRHLDIRAT